MILITGSGGKTGRAVAAALRQQGFALRLFRRPGNQHEDIIDPDQVFVGDLKKEEDIARACQGVAAIYHIGPNMHPAEDQIGRNAVEAALANGVNHFVYHSVLYPQIKAMPHHWRKLMVEQALIESGMPFTILQPAAYFQNFGKDWAVIRRRGSYRVPYPVTARLSLVDLNEVAEVAAKVIHQQGHYYATYPLASRAAPTAQEIAATMSQLAQSTIRAQEISPEQWSQTATEAGISGRRIQDFLAMFDYYSRHDFIGSATTLTWLLGREPISLEQYLIRLSQSS